MIDAPPSPDEMAAEVGRLRAALSTAATKIESIAMLDIERWACDGKTLKAGMKKIGSIAKQCRQALSSEGPGT